MKFEINNTTWQIEVVTADKMRLESENSYTMGLTIYAPQKILLLEEQANIIKVLKHELTHVWLYEYGHAQNDKTTYDFEDVCEIVASSNDFINDVVEKFKNRG